jgi:hypothetical protein
LYGDRVFSLLLGVSPGDRAGAPPTGHLLCSTAADQGQPPADASSAKNTLTTRFDHPHSRARDKEWPWPELALVFLLSTTRAISTNLTSGSAQRPRSWPAACASPSPPSHLRQFHSELVIFRQFVLYRNCSLYLA